MTSKEFREIIISNRLEKKDKEYPDNLIVSSKYTLLTFLPKNLFGQFRRMINFFFLCLIIIQISIEVPVDPIPYLAAYIFIIGVTGIKQGYEDWCRHQSDKKVNFARVHIVNHSGEIVEANSKDIKVGQIVRLDEDEPVPCDILLVACLSNSGSPQSYCQITTANLDGESNLKMRFSPTELGNVLDGKSVALNKLSNHKLKYDLPNSDLYKFSGQIIYSDKERPISCTMENVLLRGSTVKFSGGVYGISIYTGKDTRLSMNSNTSKGNKFSTVEHTMNKIVIGMFVLLLVLSSAAVGFCFLYKSNTFDGIWYLPTSTESNFSIGLTTFFSYLVLLCYLIPVSLSVTVELQKLGCSKFFIWDDEMVCPSTGTRPICNTSDLNEELGQIEYLCTDKTGTLTDNDLKFQCCSINGIKYQYSEGILIPWKMQVEPSVKDVSDGTVALISPEIVPFLKALASCHTVRVVPGNNDIQEHNLTSKASKDCDTVYQASSLDEEVLVKASYRLGVKFIGEEDNTILVDILGTINKMKRLATLEFDSDRKCMSVILEDEDGQIFLFCKGAESSIFPKCNDCSVSLLETTRNDVTEFAKTGLRTLVVAMKTLNRSSVSKFQAEIEKFQNDSTELLKILNEMETGLTILGCTGVEDKLQEGVPETLKSLKEAGIRVLMLTGDKLETAVSIALSCGLVSQASDNDFGENLAIVADFTDSNLLKQELESVRVKMKQSSSLILVMDGSTFAVGVEECKDNIRSVIIEAESVIFCRMAPLQKAQVVSLIRSYPKKKILTCAVGDGGNDCAMLKEAHVGIGIIGKEGLQAARESDFAIARFQFLQKAILVHGYWFYQRLATLITYFFYRGVVMIFQIFLYGFDSGFSIQTIFHSTFVMMFTISFTSVPVLIQGLTEQTISKEELLKNPALYKDITGNELMTFRKNFRWIVVGIWHIFLCYYVPRFIWMEGGSTGIDDYGAFSFFISNILVLITDTKILMETRYFTWWTVAGQLWSYMSMFVFYSLISQIGTSTNGDLRFSYYPLLQQTEFWLTIVLVGILSVVPDIMLLGIKSINIEWPKRANAIV